MYILRPSIPTKNNHGKKWYWTQSSLWKFLQRIINSQNICIYLAEIWSLIYNIWSNFNTKDMDERPWSQAVVVHTCNPSTLGGRGRRISEFEASLVYNMSFRTARAIPCREKTKSKKQNKTKQNKKEKPHKNMLILQIQDRCLSWFLYYFKDRQSYTAKFVLEKKSKK